MAKNQESVTREVYGPKTFIEVGNTTSNSSGGTAFTQQAINDSGERFVTSHNENGWTGVKMGIKKGLTHAPERELSLF